MTTDADTITQATKIPLRLAFGMAGLSVAALLGAFSMSEKLDDTMSSLGNSVTRIGTQLESVSSAVTRISDTLLRETSSIEAHHDADNVQLQAQLEAIKARVRELEKTQ